MFKFINKNYNQAVIKFNNIHNRKIKIISTFVMFLLFNAIPFSFFNEDGEFDLINIPISFLMALGYYFLLGYLVKRRALKINRTNDIDTVITTIKENDIIYELQTNNKKIANSKFSITDLLKGIETNEYYFLYFTPASAICIDKNTIVEGSIEEFNTFIKDNIKIKYIK